MGMSLSCVSRSPLASLANPWRVNCGYCVSAGCSVSALLGGHLCKDHVHIYIAIPPKYAVAQVVGFIKGKSAIHIAREVQGRARNFAGQNFLARGYFVSTVGRDEKVIREYIRRQEQEDQRLEQLKLVTD